MSTTPSLLPRPSLKMLKLRDQGLGWIKPEAENSWLYPFKSLFIFMFRLEEDQLDITSIHVTVVEVTQNFKHSTKVSRYIKKSLAGIRWSLVNLNIATKFLNGTKMITAKADNKLHRTIHPSHSLRLLVKYSIPPPSPANIGRNIYLHPPTSSLFFLITMIEIFWNLFRRRQCLPRIGRWPTASLVDSCLPGECVDLQIYLIHCKHVQWNMCKKGN